MLLRCPDSGEFRGGRSGPRKRWSSGRVRRPGAGRKSVEVADLGVVAALESKSTRTLARLRCRPKSTPTPSRWVNQRVHRNGDIGFSAWTVAKLLRKAGYRLQANAKTTEGRQHPESKAIGGIKNLEPLKSFPVLSSAACSNAIISNKHRIMASQSGGLTTSMSCLPGSTKPGVPEPICNSPNRTNNWLVLAQGAGSHSPNSIGG